MLEHVIHWTPARFVVGPLLLCVLLAGCRPETQQPVADEAESPPHLVAASSVEAGRYLAIVAGCNDCHTDGYLATGGNVPESDWLTGSPVGFRGPWGTTYPKNLRLTVQRMSEDEWVTTLRERKALPPMPWMNINQLSESDARALYQYLRSLGPAGEAMPQPVPPDQEPSTPFILLVPVEPGN